MAYGSISLEKRLKDNIKNYSLSSLLDTARMSDQLEILHKLSGVEVLVTDPKYETESLCRWKWSAGRF